MAPAVQFTLPPWPEATGTEWSVLSSRAEALGGRVGAGPGFSAELDLARTLIDRQDFDAIQQRLPSMRFARALASVWAHEPDRAWTSTRPELIAGIIQARQRPPSRLLLLTLAEVFFAYYDFLDQPRPGVLEALRRALIDGLQRRWQQTGEPLVDALGSLAHRSDALLQPAQLPRLAQEIEASDAGLQEWLRRSALEVFDVGRFGVRLRQEIYLRRIQAADPAMPEGLGFLAELTEETVYRAPASGGRYFGHDIVAALALRPDAPPCDTWMRTMLKIAGDPRLRHTDQWRTWWEPLGERVQRAAIRWLSHEDLELFLDAIEQFADTAERAEIATMFPSRSAFLRGLHRRNLIVETRLILADHIRAGVRRHLGSHRAEMSRLTNAHGLAVIIVDCGTFYFVEGSHNFRWGIFAGRPPDRLFDRTIRNYSRDEVYEQVVREHDTWHPLGPEAREWQTHQGYWAVRAWRFIVEQLGIDLDGRSVLDAETYQWAKYSPEGLPIVGRQLLRW